MASSSDRPSADALLRDIGGSPSLTVYLGSAPGAGKTRRLLDEGLRLARGGSRVFIGTIETKGRPDLDALAARLPRVPPRIVERAGSTFEEFAYDAAIALRPHVVILDELAHANLPGARHAKRWEDALALRGAGISVMTAFNIVHLENVAAIAERLIGFPVREIIPQAFITAADQVIALDVAPEDIEARLRAGAVVHKDDIDRALASGAFRPQNMRALREMMLRTIDELTMPTVRADRTSTALAIVTADGDPAAFVRKTAAIAEALDLALIITSAGDPAAVHLEALAKDVGARMHQGDAIDAAKPELGALRAAFVAVPRGLLAFRLVSRKAQRDVFIVDSTPIEMAIPHERAAALQQTVADRMRIGYGKLTIYLGAVAGSGKTYAMLDRAHQLLGAGVDVLAALVETHQRSETQRQLIGIPQLDRRITEHGEGRYDELDLAALIARKPAIALIDELAHTNAPGSSHVKRYDDVLSVLRAGISVITTLNIQHLAGLGDAVLRMTGQRVRETVPDAVLELADDVIFIDTTPETLRDRLRSGNIYAADRIETALSNFFRTENLAALRELAIREVVRARGTTRRAPPFARLALGVKARERDVDLIARCARIASRLEIDLIVIHVAKQAGYASRTLDALEAATERARAHFLLAHDNDTVRGLLNAARGEHSSTLAVEGARSTPRWPSGTTFARRLLDGGATQLLMLTPTVATNERAD